MVTNRTRLGTPVAVLVLAAGCSHPAEEPELRPASATFLSNDRAAAKLANANCDRELACNNIGSGRRYETKDSCLSTFEREKYEQLGFRQCVLGVDYGELDTCSREIMAANCGLRLDTLESLRSCSSARLCRD